MRDVTRWLSAQGISIPDTPVLIETAIAVALTAAALALGWLAGRRLGPLITRFWEKRVGGHAEGLGARMCDIVRHGSVVILLAICAAFWPWHAPGALVIGFVEGIAAGLVIAAVLRGLGIPRWAAWTMGLIAFVAILANAIGGFDVIEVMLQRVGFDIGKRRFSLYSVLTIAVTLIVLFALVRLANRVTNHTIANARGFDPTQKLLFQKLAGIAVLVVAFFIGIDLLDVDLTAFAVFSGALGLAVGFGLQKTVGNLIAGIILLMDRSIKPGDVIVVGDSFGWVNKIGVRAVSVITRDGKEHLIPNENLMTQEVENWSYSDKNVRVRIPVGVSYASDLKLAQELMLRAATESPRVLDNPKPNVWLAGFGDSSVDHEILAWINDPEGGVGNVRSDVLNRVWKLFKENGVEIPFPQRDVWVKGLPEPSGGAKADSKTPAE
ncbi:mechanosensitive ion channel family protein [Stakelama tenebrarum]|uniref:Mechanosensitive ion channel n=1 Tax=Stakelama tenebrarum TaxID=2711215 RepID=A0A6G6Y933_9SPHN|nr:mechanosensitive ion channel domain-containing protein [Sphingosinithalassobacter tenebrarum]QIG81444.1 mechanosensitive ion channel [Sphingosinithalassobacter tenebrarum]